MKTTSTTELRRVSGSVQRSFETILSQYERVRRDERFGKTCSLWVEFQNIAASLRSAPDVARFKNIVIQWSAGRGNWATVPWVAALDSRETSKTSEGVYLIYLFRADLSGVYLTLNQGASWLMAGSGGRGNMQLRQRASQLRSRSGLLKDAGFEVNPGIDLRSDLSLIRAYEDSTVAYKLYARGCVPDDAALLRDLAASLTVYEKLVPSRGFLGLPGAMADEE
jgi:hypothetical protein